METVAKWKTSPSQKEFTYTHTHTHTHTPHTRWRVLRYGLFHFQQTCVAFGIFWENLHRRHGWGVTLCVMTGTPGRDRWHEGTKVPLSLVFWPEPSQYWTQRENILVSQMSVVKWLGLDSWGDWVPGYKGSKFYLPIVKEVRSSLEGPSLSHFRRQYSPGLLTDFSTGHEEKYPAVLGQTWLQLAH
jgi:hypothetical protein